MIDRVDVGNVDVTNFGDSAPYLIDGEITVTGKLYLGRSSEMLTYSGKLTLSESRELRTLLAKVEERLTGELAKKLVGREG